MDAIELAAQLSLIPHAELARLAAVSITSCPDHEHRRRFETAANEAAQAAEEQVCSEAGDQQRLWQSLSRDVMTRIVDGTSACSLPVLARLDRRTSILAQARLAKLAELWRAQQTCLLNDDCEEIQLELLMGTNVMASASGTPGGCEGSTGGSSWRRISIGQVVEPRAMRALAEALSAGGFPHALALDLMYANVSDAGLRLLLAPLCNGALPLLEDFCIEANGAGNAFMVAFSDMIANGALPALLKLNLSGNYIGDKGVAAFASAVSTSGALPRLKQLLLRNNAPLSGAGMQDLASSLAPSVPVLARRCSLPSLTELVLTRPYIDHPKLQAACKARGIKLHDGSSTPPSPPPAAPKALMPPSSRFGISLSWPERWQRNPRSDSARV